MTNAKPMTPEAATPLAPAREAYVRATLNYTHYDVLGMIALIDALRHKEANCITHDGDSKRNCLTIR